MATVAETVPLAKKFASQGVLKGRTLAEIAAVVGNPLSELSTPDPGVRKLLWSEAGYVVVLVFVNGRCGGVTDETYNGTSIKKTAPQPAPKKSQNALWWLVTGSIAFIFVAQNCGSHTGSSSADYSPPSSYETRPLPTPRNSSAAEAAVVPSPDSGPTTAEKIAAIDGNSSANEIKRDQSLLDQLSSTYGITETQVADMATKGHEILGEKGVQESVHSVMEAINEIGTVGHGGHELFARMVTEYVVDRDTG